MGKKVRAGDSWKNGYSAYKAKGQCEKNRTRKLERHKAAHPNDTVAAKATIKYRRKKPIADGGWVTGKVAFSMMEYVGSTDKSKAVPYIGMRSRASQMKMAQYMKLSRKTTNESAYIKASSSSSTDRKAKSNRQPKAKSSK